MDETLKCTTTLGQSGAESNGNEGVLNTTRTSKTGTLDGI